VVIVQRKSRTEFALPKIPFGIQSRSLKKWVPYSISHAECPTIHTLNVVDEARHTFLRNPKKSL
jgi:hypothetical protein